MLRHLVIRFIAFCLLRADLPTHTILTPRLEQSRRKLVKVR